MLMMRSDLLFLSDEEVLKSLDAYKKIKSFSDVKKNCSPSSLNSQHASPPPVRTADFLAVRMSMGRSRADDFSGCQISRDLRLL